MRYMFKRNHSPISGVTIRDCFWNEKLDRLFTVTLPDTFDKFEADRTVENFDNVVSGKREFNGAWFFDGLFYETIRGAADYLIDRPDHAMEARIDQYIERIARAQDVVGDGYLSTYTLICMPDKRFGANGGNLVLQHDTYNMGCLIEAGVHYYRATGKTKLLTCAVRAANYMAGVIGDAPKKTCVPGHSMVEGALLELYRLCGEDASIAEKCGAPTDPEAYLALADHFVRMRGHYDNRICCPECFGEYAQDHAPIELQHDAAGHAVRAALFYYGASEVSGAESDEALLSHVMRLWNSAVNRKMYINGGIGASAAEEKFSTDYWLPNDGYLETCATAALIFWAQSLSNNLSDARFADVTETALYNLMLSSVSESGTYYFYCNPLTSEGADHRWPWHKCPCCPPMIHKVFSRLREFIYANDEKGVFINQYISSALENGDLRLTMDGAYPWDGKMTIRVTKSTDRTQKLRLRVPGWCRGYTVLLNGARTEIATEDGYAVLTRQFLAGDEVVMDMEMPVERVEAHPYVISDAGRVAIRRGPVVYCFEGVDNAGNVERELSKAFLPDVSHDAALFGGIPVITVRDVNNKPFRAVPLYLWDNRAAGSMRVWVRSQDKRISPVTDGWEGKLYRHYED